MNEIDYSFETALHLMAKKNPKNKDFKFGSTGHWVKIVVYKHEGGTSTYDEFCLICNEVVTNCDLDAHGREHLKKLLVFI